MTERQQVLYLWAEGSSLDSSVIGWAFHDGAGGSGTQLPDEEPPYPNGVAAMEDGWRLIQSAQLVPRAADDRHRNSYLDYEFVLERIVEI